jgi:hypothetical protein
MTTAHATTGARRLSRFQRQLSLYGPITTGLGLLVVGIRMSGSPRRLTGSRACGNA